MQKLLIVAAMSAAAAVLPTVPVAAQQMDRALVIYGGDKCPTNAAGEEIVVCYRRPEGERYRIPKELRTPIEITPENRSWAAKANETLSAGAATGIGSCSAIGAGGWSGCWAQQMRAAKAERRANAANDPTP